MMVPMAQRLVGFLHFGVCFGAFNDPMAPGNKGKSPLKARLGLVLR